MANSKKTTFKNDMDVTGALTAGTIASDAGLTAATIEGTTGVKSPLFVIDKAKGLAVTAASQTNAAAVATFPDIGDAADTVVMADTAQTLTLKTLTAPINTNPHNSYLLNSHNFAGAHADWDISTGAGSAFYIHTLTNANDPANVIVGAEVAPKWFINGSGQDITVKTADGNGIVIASTKTALVTSDGTNVIRLTADL